MLVLAVLLAQAVPSQQRPPAKAVVPPNVRRVADSFGGFTCSDGSRVIRDFFGNVTVIRGRTAPMR